MQFCVLGSALGTAEHLLISDAHFSWVSEVPDDVLRLGETNPSSVSLDYVAKLFRQEIPAFATVPHAKFFRSVGLGPEEVHWQKVLDPASYHAVIEDMVRGSRGVTDALQKSGYGSTLSNRLKLLAGLQRARIDRNELVDRIRCEQDTTQVSNLRTFMPGNDGYANVVRYDGTSTSTGRMNVSSGPRILTLRKKHRNLIRSSWCDEGEVISIDYASLEPRISLALNGYTVEGDVYEWIDTEVFNGKLGRTKAKILTLSIIYGMSLHSARSRYGDISPAAKKRLRSMFSVDETTKRLSTVPEGELRNHFGRPIFPDNKNKLFNAFIQSTAVDAAVLGFGEIVTKLQEAGGCRPLFLIHDEIICDVPISVSTQAQEIFKDGIEIAFRDRSVKFPVTVEKISAKRNG